MGVQQAQAAQAFLPGPAARQLGNQDAARLAHQDHLHSALAVDEQAQLAAQRARQKSQLAGLLGGVDVRRRKTAVEQTVQSVELARLEPLHIAFWLGNGAPSLQYADYGRR